MTTRPIRSFVLRQGRISPAQKRARDELFPRFGIQYLSNTFSFADVFGRSAKLVLEIGSGMGETTVEIAAAHPDFDYLAVEVHGPGVGSLLRKVEERGLTNVRVIQHDALEVLRDMVQTESLAAIHMFFPDPWPKKRHHKRRFLNPGSAGLMADRLARGACLHFATDWPDYADQALAVLSATPGLYNSCAGFAPRPESRPQTKFERRGLKLGHPVFDLIFQKEPRP